jgi:hypothetical protein
MFLSGPQLRDKADDGGAVAAAGGSCIALMSNIVMFE